MALCTTSPFGLVCPKDISLEIFLFVQTSLCTPKPCCDVLLREKKVNVATVFIRYTLMKGAVSATTNKVSLCDRMGIERGVFARGPVPFFNYVSQFHCC